MQSLLDLSYMPDASLAAWAFLLAVVAATLVSEDLTAVSVGALVAEGKVGFLFGTFACDVLLYLAGRWAGRPALARAPLKWLVNEAAVERSSAWFERRGAWVIAASRFAPGTRLPTYFAAGMLRTSFTRFTFYFAVACAVWTPLLVALSALVGGEVIKSALFDKQHLIVGTLLAGVLLLLIIKTLLRLTTWRGRRMFVGRWRRLVRWEFWPPWAFYPPVVVYIAWLALKHRSLTLFTAANPAIESGGFVGESKSAILDGLAAAGSFVALSELIPAGRDGAGADERISHVGRFMAAHQLSFPVVLKPDVGQRGAGVKVVRSDAEVREFFINFRGDAIVQEYAPGEEFGVFYYRLPGAARGRIFSITEKRMPVVTGDGASTLEQLILADGRAVCLARFYCGQQRERLHDLPAAGERVQLVELGTHCRGAIFLDGARLKTEALEEAIDRVSRAYEGFYFGRFDIRTPSLDDFQRGENFKVIELNGVTSEATHIYDPRYSLFAAYRVLFAQWRIAFEIGALNRARGMEPTSARELIRLTVEFQRSVGATAG
jgi:membrane protein DedA with SNARE-associated domain